MFFLESRSDHQYRFVRVIINIVLRFVDESRMFMPVVGSIGPGVSRIKQ